MSIFSRILNSIQSGALSESELLQLANSIKENYLEIFDQTLIEVLSNRNSQTHAQTNLEILIQDILDNRFTSQQLAKIQDSIVYVNSLNEAREKRFAIIFSGEYRTGNEVLKRNRILFKSIFPNTDFFVSTRTTYKLNHDPLHGTHRLDTEFTITEEQIKDNFGTDNCYVSLYNDTSLEELGFYTGVPPIPLNYMKHLYLILKACKLKQSIEKKQGFVYDQVIHTRPDLYFRKANPIGDFIMSPLCHPDEIVGCNPQWVEEIKEWQSPDLYFRMDSLTHNKFCEMINQLDDIVAWINETMPDKTVYSHNFIAAWVLMLNLKEPKMFAKWTTDREWSKRDPENFKPEFAYQVIRKYLMGNLNLDSMDWYLIQSQNLRNY